MRWDNLSIEEEEKARLPGYRDEAVVRHFEAPDAVPTRFYEVRAKSILNRVPPASQMPFRWTINPYRGCSHACAYCISGDTPILMADGRHKRLDELEVGEAIYGTRVADSGYRHYVRTTVLDKWTTIKPACRVTLESGTELIVSGDHRFLSDRGWKHVLNRARGQPRRPHLTVANRLVGTGPFPSQPAHTPDYRRGYVRGIVRGDGGTLAAVETGELVVQNAAGAYRETVDVAAGGQFERTSELIEWPLGASEEWSRGFLAGLFDAEGSRSPDGLRIANTDPQILAWAEACARRFGFEVAVEPTPQEHGLRIRGGLSDHLRFFHITDPASARKRDIEGEMVETLANLRVVEIEPLGGELPLYDITTGTGDFIADGVVSHNCFARPTHTYLDFDAGRDFEREIIVKVNAPERLRVELAKPSWKGEHIAMGTNTDPYQWVEGRYKLMQGIWQAMIDARNPGSILTKSPLLLRDLPLMIELAKRADFSAALSIPTMEEKAWRATEPHTPNPRARMAAVAELTRAGIRTGILVAPLMPGINDDPAQVAEILEMASEAGADYVSGIALHLRGEVRGLFMEWLAEHRPDLLPRYRALYRRGAYAPQVERRRLSELVRGPDLAPSERGRAAFLRAPEPPTPARQPQQESLFELHSSS
ncbi:MAG: LAGLIDADG family homing endonuclease [Solirubrobacteraceae bacterium]